MTPEEKQERRATWSIALVGAARAAFGVVWAINAFLSWRPAFAANYVGYLKNASQGQPDILRGWLDGWIAVVGAAPGLFVWSTRIIETLLALALLAGFARRATYVLGAAFSVLVWATAEGFSGPYVTGAANIGPALVYVLLFFALWLCERIVGPTPYGVDAFIARRVGWWSRVAEPAPGALVVRPAPTLPWVAQGAAIAAIGASIIVLVSGLESALAVPAATPQHAAAALSPLSVAAPGPVPEARDPRLPPLLANGNDTAIRIEARDELVQIAHGVTYQAWTFDGSVPAPTIHVRQGQVLDVTFVNSGTMQHSIDFHAAQIAPNVAYRSVDPHETVRFQFRAEVPGAFIYHCGTPPVLVHIANGMYGVIVVDPAKPLPPADESYVLMQSEWYTAHVQSNRMRGDLTKMTQVRPDEVVFNGVAFQYRDHPLPARAGERVRIYFVDAGPNLPSAFHVIGGIFERVYSDGDPAHAQTGVSTYAVPPGGGAVFDVILAEPGEYTFVDHSMRNMSIGALGVLRATR